MAKGLPDYAPGAACPKCGGKTVTQAGDIGGEPCLYTLCQACPDIVSCTPLPEKADTGSHVD